MTEQATKVSAESNSLCTFKPCVSEKSALSLGTNFEKRQEVYFEKKRRSVSCIAFVHVQAKKSETHNACYF